MLKKYSFVILLCGILLLTACGKTSETVSNNATAETSSTVFADSSTPYATPEVSTTPSALDSTDQQSQPPASSSAATNTPANNSTAGTTSRPTNPPATSTPPPRTSQPATSTPAPQTSSTPTPSTPTKPTYTEADYQKIIDTIRAYGEGKGFIWNDSFTFEQGHQYYGRPNLERDGYDGVINTLKYHCDKILSQYGICQFKVVKHIYEGNTEFIVLYD